MQKISLAEFTDNLDLPASSYVKERFPKGDFQFENLSTDESNNAILDLIKNLERNLSFSGEHRKNAWENGWEEVYKNYEKTNSIESLIPQYFGKYPLVRWNKRLIRPRWPKMEYQMFGIMLDLIISNYLPNFENIFEFGCGTGHNLHRIRQIIPKANLFGLDFATTSQKTITRLALNTNDSKLNAVNFNYFKPNYEVEIPPNSAIITIASMEQTGSNYKEFVDFILKKKPALIINVEPISELLDANNLLDYISIKYMEKRNYLNNYLQHLDFLEKSSRIQILKRQRSGVGSYYIDGYSIVIWKPI